VRGFFLGRDLQPLELLTYVHKLCQRTGTFHTLKSSLSPQPLRICFPRSLNQTLQIPSRLDLGSTTPPAPLRLLLNLSSHSSTHPPAQQQNPNSAYKGVRGPLATPAAPCFCFYKNNTHVVWELRLSSLFRSMSTGPSNLLTDRDIVDGPSHARFEPSDPVVCRRHPPPPLPPPPPPQDVVVFFFFLSLSLSLFLSPLPSFIPGSLSLCWPSVALLCAAAARCHDTPHPLMPSVVWGIHRFPGWLFLEFICVCVCVCVCLRVRSVVECSVCLSHLVQCVINTVYMLDIIWNTFISFILLCVWCSLAGRCLHVCICNEGTTGCQP